MDYKQSGVDIDAGNETVRRIKQIARSTFTPGVLSEIGSFGGLFRLDPDAWRDPVLVASADGVGTKLKIAFLADQHRTIGVDLVNHCVNDILVQGAVPLFFLDYLATGRLSPEVAAQVVEGLARACRDNGCALLGGETAEMPGFYAEGEYDVAGFIVGAVDRERVIDGRRIVPGDVLIGLPSSGLHTNGYSLARKIVFDGLGLTVDSHVPELGETVGEALLRPHRSYLPVIKPLLASGLIKGMAHITGGGITDNLPRILPPGTAARIERQSWRTPAIFRWLGESGSVPEMDLRRSFNMGIGLIAAVAATDAEALRARLHETGEANAVVIGDVVAGDGKVLYRMTRLGILISGRGSNLQAIIDATRDGRLDATIAVVISNTSGAAGLQRAAAAGIETLVMPHTGHPSREHYDRALVGELQKRGVGLVCLAGFMRLLSPSFIRAFPHRILNIHPSLLPAFPGVDAPAQAIAAGAATSGATVHFVNEDLDAGPIVLQREVPVLPGDIADTLAARILEVEHRLYPEAIASVLATLSSGESPA